MQFDWIVYVITTTGSPSSIFSHFLFWKISFFESFWGPESLSSFGKNPCYLVDVQQIINPRQSDCVSENNRNTKYTFCSQVLSGSRVYWFAEMTFMQSEHRQQWTRTIHSNVFSVLLHFADNKIKQRKNCTEIITYFTIFIWMLLLSPCSAHFSSILRFYHSSIVLFQFFPCFFLKCKYDGWNVALSATDSLLAAAVATAATLINKKWNNCQIAAAFGNFDNLLYFLWSEGYGLLPE